MTASSEDDNFARYANKQGPYIKRLELKFQNQARGSVAAA